MISHRVIGNTFLFLYIMIYLVGQAVGSVLVISISPILAFLSLFFFRIRINQKIFLFFSLIFSVVLLILLTNNHYPYERLAFNLVFLSANIMISINFKRDVVNIKYLLMATLFFLYLFFFVCLIISLARHVTVYVYMDSLLIGFSYNYISGYLILATSLLMAHNELYDKKEELPLIMTALILVLVLTCFMLYGRSGIAFSVILAVIHFRKYWTINNGLKTFLVSVITICVVLFFIQQSQIIIHAISDSKFKEGLQSPRSIMLAEYVKALDLRTLLIGVDMRELPMIAAFNVNPHNSFVNLHSMLGLLAIIILIVMAVRLINILTLRFYAGVLLFIYLLRGGLDTMIMPGVLDFAFIILFALPLSKKRKKLLEV